MARPLSKHAQAVFRGLEGQHPEAACELSFGSPFQLLVATVLSAQSTDKLVNKVTATLFPRYPAPEALARATPEQIESELAAHGLGMYRQKAKSITKLARQLVDGHGGQVPRTLAQLVELAGVGRKTANLVLGVCFGASEGVVVDTHVLRVSQRLGLTESTTPEEVERDLGGLYRREQFDRLSHLLIFHGRRICGAKKPQCTLCALKEICPVAFEAEHVGRKPPRKPEKPEAKTKAKVSSKAAKPKTAKPKTAKPKTAQPKTGAKTKRGRLARRPA